MPCLWVHRFISAMIKTAPLVLRLSVSPELLEQYFYSHILSRSHTNYLQSSEPITYEIYLVTPNIKRYQRIAHLWHVLCAGIWCLLPLFLELFPYQLILFLILCNLKEKKKKKIMEIFVIKALLHMAVKIPAQIRVSGFFFYCLSNRDNQLRSEISLSNYCTVLSQRSGILSYRQ